MFSMFTIFRTLLVFVHFFYKLFLTLRDCCSIVNRAFVVLVNEFIYNKQRVETEILVKNVKNMEKLPRHLVIVFGKRGTSVFNCVEIIVWCIVIGIPYISFYDRNGFFVENEDKIRKEFIRRRPDLVEYVNWSQNTSNGHYGNGIIGHKKKIKVFSLSYADGKGELVSLAQKLAEGVSNQKLKPEQINDELITEKLRANGIPEPDLVLIFGSTCSTCGLLPWHTRTTEFLTCPLSVNLSVNEFICLLRKYSKSEQRYGK